MAAPACRLCRQFSFFFPKLFSTGIRPHLSHVFTMPMGPIRMGRWDGIRFHPHLSHVSAMSCDVRQLSPPMDRAHLAGLLKPLQGGSWHTKCTQAVTKQCPAPQKRKADLITYHRRLQEPGIQS